MRTVKLAFVAVVLGACVPAAAQTSGEGPKDIIAAQIREQGFQCDDPQSATRDAEASAPDEAVWVLQCEGSRYRVRLDPDMAARVERLDGKEDNDR